MGTSGGYAYVLKTKGMAPGSYQLHVSATGDPIDHALPFILK